MNCKYSMGDGKIEEMFMSLGKNIHTIYRIALYEGAKVVADEVRKNTPKDTGDLADSLFIADFLDSYEGTGTVIGFAGYDSKGIPNPMKAAVLESGSSSGHKATHFFSHAVNNSRARAQETMKKIIEKEINEITGGT